MRSAGGLEALLQYLAATTPEGAAAASMAVRVLTRSGERLRGVCALGASSCCRVLAPVRGSVSAVCLRLRLVHVLSSVCLCGWLCACVLVCACAGLERVCLLKRECATHVLSLR